MALTLFYSYFLAYMRGIVVAGVALIGSSSAVNATLDCTHYFHTNACAQIPIFFFFLPETFYFIFLIIFLKIYTSLILLI